MSVVYPIFRYDTNNDYKPLLIGPGETEVLAYEMLAEYKAKHSCNGDYEYTVTPKPLNQLFD